MICDATPELGHSVVVSSVYTVHLNYVKDNTQNDYSYRTTWAHCGSYNDLHLRSIVLIIHLRLMYNCSGTLILPHNNTVHIVIPLWKGGSCPIPNRSLFTRPGKIKTSSCACIWQSLPFSHECDCWKTLTKSYFSKNHISLLKWISIWPLPVTHLVQILCSIVRKDTCLPQ